MKEKVKPGINKLPYEKPGLVYCSNFWVFKGSGEQYKVLGSPVSYDLKLHLTDLNYIEWRHKIQRLFMNLFN